MANPRPDGTGDTACAAGVLRAAASAGFVLRAQPGGGAAAHARRLRRIAVLGPNAAVPRTLQRAAVSRTAVPDTDVLMDCLQHGFDEVLAVGGGTGHAVLPISAS